MRFMVMRRADALTESGALPGEEILAAMAKYNEEMVNGGVMVAGDGLKPSSEGARVKFTNGKPKVIDGPFADRVGEALAGVRHRSERRVGDPAILRVVGFRGE